MSRIEGSTPAQVVHRAGRAHGVRGFTLIEVMVAVGAVALVAVGLAAIFDAVGKTVSGGKRVSYFTQYASLLDTQIRNDMSRMTREGPLLIRQQYVDRSGDGRADPTNPGNDVVPLYPDEPLGDRRMRRIDELVFFATGQYTTARAALDPKRVAKSNVARIYYGHGERYTFDAFRKNVNQPQMLPDGVTSESALGQLQPGGVPQYLGKPGLNEFARDWTLLHHQTLLTQPGGELAPSDEVILGVDLGTPVGASRARDRDYQIAWQPAARGIFRSYTMAQVDITQWPLLYDTTTYSFQPTFNTGLVDIATTDLREMRSYVNGMDLHTYEIGISQGGGSQRSVPIAVTFTPSTRVATRSRPAANAFESLDYMHEWMENIFPTNSAQAQTGQTTGVGSFPPLAATLDPPGRRMRYEPDPPGYLDALYRDSQSGGTPLEKAIDRANRQMLTASAFVPHCTEFIVEWTSGLRDKDGNLVWHGLERRLSEDRDNDGQLDLAAEPYPPRNAQGQRVYLTATYPFVRNDGTVEQARHDFTERLFYGLIPTQNPCCLTTYFGTVDPTFSSTRNELTNSTGNAVLSRPIEWPWPTAIRIFVTLCDPRDPTVEETFEFTYEIPDAPKN